MKKALIFSIGLLLTLGGCKSAASRGAADIAGDTLTTEARLLTLIRLADSSYVAELHDPSDPSRILTRLHLAESDDATPVEGTTFLKIPVGSMVAGSGIHTDALERLGAMQAIKGVFDAQFFSPATSVAKGLYEGSIQDVGESTAPIREKILMLHPDIILTAGYPARGLDEIPATVVAMTDYLESTPLGRAEWVKFLGVLAGNEQLADSMFETEKTEYGRLSRLAAKSSDRRKVITERMQGDGWYIPAGESYMARMLVDAGGVYPWSDTKGSGSLSLPVTQVYDVAGDADVWLLRSYGPLSLRELGAGNDIYAHFKAFGEGGVWIADTRAVPLFEEFPFRPSLLLRDYIYILNPSLRDSLPEPRYFRNIRE